MRTISEIIHHLGTNDNTTVKWSMLIVFIVLVAVMFPQGPSVQSEYNIGMIWTENDLYAPFAFPIYKEDQAYKQECTLAASKVYKVFEEHPDVAKNSIDSLQNFCTRLRTILDGRKRDSSVIAYSLAHFPVNFTNSEWKALWMLRDAERRNHVKESRLTLDRLERDVMMVVNGLYLQGILDVRKSHFPGDSLIAKRKKNLEQIVPLSRILERDELGKIVEQTYLSGYRGDNDTVSIATKLTLSFLTPNVFYLKDQTEKEIRFAVEMVPRTLGAVQENERIIGKNDRVTPELKLKLNSLRKAKAELGADVNRAASFIGKLLHVFSIMLLFSIYIFLFRKRIFRDNAKILLILLIFFFVSLTAFLTVNLELEFPAKLLIAVPAGAMLLGIIFDSRVAFYSTVAMSLLVAGIRGNDYSVLYYSLVAGLMGVYTVRDIKKRTQIFRSISYIFLGFIIAILAVSLERYDGLIAILNQALVAGISAVLSPIVTYGSLIFLERFFKLTTDLTLLELSDLNQPLLKELAQKAPGTFHHSVSIGTLAEAAADEIGANGTLSRVGAYYHDIGKIANPSMFVENQLGSENKHRSMSPKKSAKIIADHVNDGVELGRKHNIPESVLNFIPMHHGTTKIGYFYEQAIRHRKKMEPINEDDFRYPGPRPNSKETGIVMLADAVEASTRAIQEPTVEKIEENIDSLIKVRFMDRELDECDLTLRDLTKIKEIFLKTLIGVYHARLSYPETAPPVAEEAAPEPVRPTKKSKEQKTSADKRLQRRIESIDT